MPASETASVAPRTEPGARRWPWGFALFVGAFVFGAGACVQAAAWEGHSFRGALLHVSFVASLVVLASWRLVDGVALRLLGARGPVLAWRSMHFGALALAACHAYNVGYFMHSSWSFFDWFGRLWELEPEYGAVPVATFLAAAALVRASVATRRRLRFEAWVAAALALALLAGAGVRASHRPEVNRYVTSLPELGVLGATTYEPRGASEGEQNTSSRYDDFTLGGLRARRYVFPGRGQCALALARDGDPPRDIVPYEDARRVPCERLSARVDRAPSLLVLHRTTEWSDANSPFDLATLEPLRDYNGPMTRFHDAFSLPRPWAWASAALLLFALAALVAPQRVRARLAAWRSWRQGTLRADGTIAFEDGSVALCPYGTALEPGPVVLLDALRASTAASPFRDATTAPTPERDAVLPGTVAEVVASFEARVDARYAFATAAAMLSMAPWPAALLEGLIP